MAKRVRKPAKRMTSERVVAILMQEMADIRLELKQDIQGLKVELTSDMADMKADIHAIKGDLSTLRLEVHQNQLMFMGYMDRTDKRLDKVEARAA